MPGGYRCSVGHTWTHVAEHSPIECPVCGDTVVMSLDPTAEAKVHQQEFVLAVPAGIGGGKDPTLPPDALPIPSTPFPAEPQPSFSSLVGMPGEISDRFGIDPDDVVPFGDPSGTFTPPIVPGYEILEEVGRGGMGVVYKALQLSLNRPVALKMILAGSHAGASERERFRREAESVAALQNPHIVQIHEIGEASGHLYLALEFVNGGSLAQHLSGVPWPPSDAAELIELLARTIHFAHGHGIVHRDLKPGNILLSGARKVSTESRRKAETLQSRNATTSPPLPGFIPKITDFGLAKRMGDSNNLEGTKTGAVMGTPSYIAPEQASGKAREVGAPADVYSLGAILYELLTGRPPFTGETPLDTVLQVLNDEPVQPKRLQPAIPRDLETICLKCLEKSPAKRYADADALADDLRRFLKSEPIKARPVMAWGRTVKWARRHPSLALLGSATVAATVALVVVLSVAYVQVRDAVRQKENEANAALLARGMETQERERAERLAAENEKGRKEVIKRNEELKQEAERTRRSAYALQLAQIAAMCEQEPDRARTILEDPKRCPIDLRDFVWAYLHRLCHREERIYRRHQPNDALHAVAYSPTGMFVATAGDSGDIRVWDPRTGITWMILTGTAGQVRSLAFSPDGRVIVGGGADKVLRLWRIPTDMLTFHKIIESFPVVQRFIKPESVSPAIVLGDAHTAEVTCVAFSPDGRALVSGDESGMLRWWDVWGWQPTNYDAAIASGMAAVAASVDHARSSPTARPVRELRQIPLLAHPGGVLSIAFSAGGEVLVSGGADKAARVWAADGTKLIRTFTAGFTEPVSAVAATPDGRRIAAVSNGTIPTIRLMSVSSGKEIRRMIGHSRWIYALAISADGELLASGGLDKSVRLWSLEDGVERGHLLGHEQRVSSLAFSPDHRSVVSVGMEGVARVWQTTVRRYESLEVASEFPPLAVTVSARGNSVVVGDERGLVKVFSTDNLADWSNQNGPITLTAPEEEDSIRAITTTPSGRMVIASNENALLIWQNFLPATSRPTTFRPFSVKYPVSLRVPSPVYAVATTPDGRIVATLDRDGVRMWNLDSVPGTVESPDVFINPEGPGLVAPLQDAKDFSFNPSGTKLAVAVGKGVRIIDQSGKTLFDLPSAHSSRVESVTFGGKLGELLATGDSSGTIKIWHVGARGDLVAQAELQGHNGPINSLSFSPNGRTLASGGYDRTIMLWDTVTGQERAIFTGHTDQILHVHFLPDASALIAVGRDGMATRWRAD